MADELAVLKITDGTTEVSLLRSEDNWSLNSWIPGIAQAKGGGVWQQSSLSDGKQLVDRHFDNVIELFDIKADAITADNLIQAAQDLIRLLEKAVQYWITDWQNDPVWIEARASCETNTRYAIIFNYSVPQLNNPYAQPFMQNPRVLNNITLNLERGHWLEEAPGTGVATNISGLGAFPASTPTASPTQSTDDCYVDDDTTIYLAFTFLEMGKSYGRDQDIGIRFRTVSIPNGATITSAYISLVSAATLTFNMSVRIYGELNATPATFSTVGDFTGRTRTTAFVDWDFAGQWTEGIDYRTPDISTIVQEIVNLGGWSSGNNMVMLILDDGSSSRRDAASWDNVTYAEPVLVIEYAVDDATTFGQEATTLDTVYVANKQNTAQLTNVYYDDGGAFSGNLVEAAVPYDFLPAVPAVNDAAYFGATGGPFCSLVFDLFVAQTDLTTVTWQYWNGAWVALTEIHDNTNAGGIGTGDPFDTTGVNSVHWLQEDDWALTVVNGVNAYWVRALVGAIGAAPAPPEQQNRNIYTIIWPFVDMAATQVTGDITALARIRAHNQCDGGTECPSHRLVIGSRSVSRGTQFAAYLNASDEQNPDGVTVAVSGTTSIATHTQAPTGRYVLYNPAGVEAMGASTVEFELDSSINTEYYGRFRAFLRVWQTAGADPEFQARIVTATRTTIAGTTNTSDVFTGDTVTNTGTVAGGPYETMDLGQLILPGIPEGVAIAIDELLITVELACTDGTPNDLRIYDLILMPIDEWAGDSVSINYGGYPGYGRQHDVDSISYPKAFISDVVNTADANEYIVSNPQIIANGQAQLQANAQQRIWFFAHRITSTSDDPIPSVHLAHSVRLSTVQRYLTMRGDD